MRYQIGEADQHKLNQINEVVHQCNLDAGWWNDMHDVIDVIDGAILPMQERRLMQKKVKTWFIMSKIALIHSEISEMLEGVRKGKADDHLPHRDATEVEGADAFIRLADLMGHLQADFGGAVGEKFEYNQVRPDHKKDAREGKEGKLV